MIVRHRYPTLRSSGLSGVTIPTQIDELDRTFGQLVSSFFDTPAFGPAVRADWVDDQYVLTVDLPGVPADAVSVEVTGTTLKIGASQNGSDWSRSLRLGGSLDPDKVAARYLDGRLTVTIGTFDQPEARKVEIETSRPEPAQAAIDAGSSESDAAEIAQESSEAN